MTTAADVIAVARSQVGYIEGQRYTGGGQSVGNQTKYWDELEPAGNGSGWSWCAGFVSWVFKHAGFPLPAMDRPYGFINCYSAVNYAKAHGLFSADGHYAPGDIVLYGIGGGQHTGIVVSDDGQTLVTIEGNTSSGESGSQVNGGGVYLRHRPHGSFVYGVMQTSKLLSKSDPPSRGVSRPPVPQPVKGADRARVAKLQGLLEVTADGVWGDTTDEWALRLRTAARAHCGYPKNTVAPFRVDLTQKVIDVTPDGAWGPQSQAALVKWVKSCQGVLGETADGSWGPGTDAAFVSLRSANHNRF